MQIQLVRKPVTGLLVNFCGKRILFCLCHHLPERSIKFFGIENYLCARCFGLLVGTILGFITLIFYHIPFLVSILFLIPLIIDGFTQAFSTYESTNPRRFITGLIFGLALPPFTLDCVNLFYWLLL